MKKNLSLMLCLGLVLVVAGCGSEKEYTPSETRQILEDNGCEFWKGESFSGNEEIQISNEKNSNSLITAFIDEEGEIAFAFYQNDNVKRGHEIESYKDSTNEKLTNKEKKLNESIKNEYNVWLDKMNISEKDLTLFLEWYNENN